MKPHVLPIAGALLALAWSVGCNAQNPLVGERIVVATPPRIATVDLTTGAKSNRTLAARYGMNQHPQRRPQVALEAANPAAPNVR